MTFLLILGISTVTLFISAFLGKKSNLPILIFYIFAGILISNLYDIGNDIKLFSEIGIVILFFYLGLEFNIERVFFTAKRIWAAGLIDLFFNFLIVFILLISLSYDLIVALAMAGITYASSSAITTKIIIDNHRIANSETEFILGLMVFEDIIAPILVALIAAYSVGSEPSSAITLSVLAKIFVVIGLTLLIAKFAKNHLSKFVEKYLSDEILTLFIFGIVILAAGISHNIGLSEALGAFLVGLIIAETGKSHQIQNLVVPIRDIMISYFFFIFGSEIIFKFNFDSFAILTLVLLLIVSIIGKLLTGIIGGRLYGLSNRRSAISGLSIINRGEFSIAISQYIGISFFPLISIYIFLIAILGTLTAQFAPRIAKFFVKSTQNKN
ncbi:MAG: cation:proton antiporter [Candidatus Kapaibacteriota bacterium]